MSKVIILRPEPGASATLARAKAAGIEALCCPLFEVVPVPWVVPDAREFDALVITSANAARHGGSGLAALSGLPTYCVGDVSAEAALDAGLKVVAFGPAGAAALIKQVPAGLRLLHLAGADHRETPGITAIAVYDSRVIDPPPPLGALHGGVAMVHSPRAGKRLAELISERGDIAIAAISDAAADACGDGWRKVAAIRAPADGALLALANELCQDQGR